VRKTGGWGGATSSSTAERLLFLHRKGAAPIDGGPVVIPGSRGAFSYLVVPGDDAAAIQEAAYSVAHGAGRKWTRSHALGVGSGRRRSARDLTTTALGGQVVCDDRALLFEEQPDAYKEIGRVVDDLVTARVARVVAVLRPVVTYKTRRFTGL
jgi:release factor H-coupled RctB family protein